MITSGFTNAPVSRFLVFGTVIGALVASLTDTRYYIHIQVVPHFWRYGQFWRVLTWQVCNRRRRHRLCLFRCFFAAIEENAELGCQRMGAGT